jgi:hypothetical protein
MTRVRWKVRYRLLAAHRCLRPERQDAGLSDPRVGDLPTFMQLEAGNRAAGPEKECDKQSQSDSEIETSLKRRSRLTMAHDKLGIYTCAD